MRPRALLTLVGLALLLAGAAALRLLVGDEGSWHWPESGPVWGLRGHQVIAGVIVGAALAVGGVMLQSLLRNPLASPDLIGLASGAGLGVMVWVYLGFVGGAAGVALGTAAAGPAALAGALGTLAVVYALGQRRGLIDPVSLILVGVMVSIICGAAAMLLAQLMPDRGFGVARWTIGSLSEDTGAAELWAVGAATAAGVGLGIWLGPAMDVAALSEDEARSVGVRLGALRLALFLAAGVLTAGAVVLAGPIGFVGLVCPHVVRLLAGPGHRVLVAGAAMAGAVLIVSADALVTAVDLGSGRLPIGILTALVGGPVFIALLRREGRTGL